MLMTVPARKMTYSCYMRIAQILESGMSFRLGIGQNVNIEGSAPVRCFEASEFSLDFPLTSDLRARSESKRLPDPDGSADCPVTGLMAQIELRVTPLTNPPSIRTTTVPLSTSSIP